MAEQKNRCGAKTRQGNACRNYAMANGRCRMHGGKSLKGTASRTYKHGLYSKYVGDQLKDVMAELESVDSDELVNPESEIKLMQALIMKCKAIKGAADDLRDLDTISKVIDRLIGAKQRYQVIMIEQSRLIPIDDIRTFINFMENLLVRKIGEEKAYTIMEEIQTFKISEVKK